jgi:6-pyruvoyltetrahydropterin/6-carboxytetrahydropterin synthase
MKKNLMKVAVIRKGHFNAAHRLFRPDWSDEMNREVFGICSHPNYHGHNYEFDVRVTGEVNPETGIVIDLKKLKELIEVHVELPFDHKNLNVDCPEFADRIPTAENICIEIYRRLRGEIPPEMDLHIRLSETPRNFVEFPA